MATIIKSIGSGAGRDYATIQAFIDSIPTDLVAAGNAYVGEVYNDSEITNVTTGKINITGKTTDVTHNITIRCAAGHSFRDHATRATNPLWYNQAYGVGIKLALTSGGSTVINVTVPYTVIDGLQLMTTTNWCYGVVASGTGIVIRNCIFITTTAEPPTYGANVINSGALMHNCLVVVNCTSRAGGVSLSGGTIESCTIVRPTTFTSAYSDGAVLNYNTNVAKNCAIFGFPVGNNVSQNSFSNSDYNGTDRAAGIYGAPGGTNATHNVTSLVYADQFVSTTNDFRLKSGSGLINVGFNLSSTLGSTDVLNNIRPTTWDIGAYELPEPATAVLLSGPAQGYVNQASSNFSVTINGSSAAVTVTPSDGGKGGTFTPASVNLSSNTPSATFTYTPVVTGNISISVANNASLGNPAAVTYLSAVPATKLLLTAPTGLGRAGVLSPNFTVATDGMVSGTITVVPSDGADGSFNPPFVTLNANTQSATFSYVGTSAGTKTILLTNNGSLQNASAQYTIKAPIVAVPTPSTSTLQVKSIGTGKDFATVKDFCTYARGFDLTANGMSLLGEVYESQSVSSIADLNAVNGGSLYTVTLQPVPGMDANTLDSGYPCDYGTEGIELTVTGGWRIGYGAIVQNFRINVNGAASLAESGIGSATGTNPVIRRNRIKIATTGGVIGLIVGEFACKGTITDNLFILADGTTGDVLGGNGTLTILRNTFVRRGSATGAAINCSNGNNTLNQDIVRNNVFLGFGGNELIRNASGMGAGKVTSNYADAAPLAALTGVTVLTGNLVRDVTSDLRPDDAGPLIAAASTDAIDTIDMYGRARGGSPDAGAVQGTYVNTLPKVTVTGQDINAQRIIISGTTVYVPTSGTAILPAAASNPNGAAQQGPTAVTLTDGGFSVEWDNVPPGNYGAPIITLSNSGGYNRSQTGGEAISILGISASIVAGESSPTVGNAPVVTIEKCKFDNTTLSVAGTVDTQGDANCSIKVYVDPLPSGTSLGPYTANIVGTRWFVQIKNMSGNFQVRAVGTANSLTAPAVTSNLLKILTLTAKITLPTGS